MSGVDTIVSSQSSKVLFDDSTKSNPFASLLPSNTTATACVPIFELDGTPAIVMLATTDEQYATFQSSDARFLRNLGAVLVASILRAKALQADQAKLAFVSQISHELRTPLHAISSQLELMREVGTPEQLRKWGPLLDVSDVSMEALKDVLEDTLDFAKLASLSQHEIEEAHKRALVMTDLRDVVDSVVKACWVRKRRVDLVNAQGPSSSSNRGKVTADAKEAVDLILEIEQAAAGWQCMCNAGALRRVLLNLIGNSLKFTERGHVLLKMRRTVKDGVTCAVFAVEDTGCGISEQFIKSGRIFMPFVQEVRT